MFINVYLIAYIAKHWKPIPVITQGEALFLQETRSDHLGGFLLGPRELCGALH